MSSYTVQSHEAHDGGLQHLTEEESVVRRLLPADGGGGHAGEAGYVVPGHGLGDVGDPHAVDGDGGSAEGNSQRRDHRVLARHGAFDRTGIVYVRVDDAQQRAADREGIGPTGHGGDGVSLGHGLRGGLPSGRAVGPENDDVHGLSPLATTRTAHHGERRSNPGPWFEPLSLSKRVGHRRV